jgi:L,D-transpeptidase ErfK/SrfK
MPNRKTLLSRRTLIAGAGAAAATTLAAPALAQIVEGPGLERRVSGFVTYHWQDYFDNLENGAILSDTVNRYLFFWSEDGAFEKIYPTSVPLTDELTRRGRTKVVRMREGPEWRPTPSMLERNPDLPDYVEPGPQNPLGTHALYLEWEFYRIHGTNDVRKIGRRSSNGCIGLYNEHIAQVFQHAKVGTQVVLI